MYDYCGTSLCVLRLRCHGAIPSVAIIAEIENTSGVVIGFQRVGETGTMVARQCPPSSHINRTRAWVRMHACIGTHAACIRVSH